MSASPKINPDNLSITKIETGSVLASLNALFGVVMSGKEYNKEQVRSATVLTNSMVKVLRFEFDIFKYFNGRVAGK